MARRYESHVVPAGSLLLVLVVLAAWHVDAYSQKSLGERRVTARGAREKAPLRFVDYPAREVYRGRIAPVVLDSKRARLFRTRLREDSQQGPNFAGRYTVVFWGCGTGCARVAVVDARSGRVYWPPLDYVDIPDDAGVGAKNRNFRLDSKLLVLTRARYDGRGSYTAYYYLFDRNRFRLIRQAEEHHLDATDSQP